jgi:uncharacterized membrane protein
MARSLDHAAREHRQLASVALGSFKSRHPHTAAGVQEGEAWPLREVSFMSKTRIETFSDGVFAIAITLLVLAFVLPEVRQAPLAEGELTRSLVHLWPNLVAYAMSFAVIGLMWHNHQALFRLVERVHRGTILLNLLLLGVVAFIPFATSVLGSYPAQRPAALLYGATLTASGVTFNLLIEHLRRSGAFNRRVPAGTVQQTAVSYRIGMTTYAGATVTAFVAPLLSFALYLLILTYFLFPRGVDSDLRNASHPTT